MHVSRYLLVCRLKTKWVNVYTKKHLDTYMFFFKWRQKLCLIRLIKKKFYKKIKRYNKGLLSRHNITQPLRPDRTHKRASHLIFSTITKVGECLLRKTLALRSFHTSKTVRMVREAKALRWGERPATKSDHHSLMPRPPHCLGCNPWSPSQSLRNSHILVVKRQATKRWSCVSVACLQRGQSPQFGHPRFSLMIG
jgi:hypothetical protein